ncbi:MAG: Tol-Pal system protein TolB [Alphaproteobacteria bacterium]|nr:Tol-Pal system protein TolB [Alphaproteobacteria bacterium]
MIFKTFFQLFTLTLFFCSFGFKSYALLKIDVSGAKSDPLPIALSTFSGKTEQTRLFGKELTEIIEKDLTSSGLFRSLDKASFIEILDSVNQKPTFENWMILKAQALLYGEITELPETEKVSVSFRLFDVFAQKQIEGAVFSTRKNNLRRIAHLIADKVYERITGEKGYFDTRIVYVAETGPQKNRIKRLALMDRDGANLRYLTNGNYLVLTPRFSPNSYQITYLSFFRGIPRIYLYDLTTGEKKVVGDFPGMTFSPRFSPDGQSLLMSLSRKGNTEIYLYDLTTKTKERLTRHPAIDTSPCFSPDGTKIVFNSDRGGSQQLYIMNKDGSHVKRLTFGKENYATPVWSPRGDYIAFTKIKSGKFYIGLIRPNGSAERLIANGFLVEGPSFSPNGRKLLFYRSSPFDDDGDESSSSSKIYSIDITGYNEQLIATETDASDPTWSALLPSASAR